MPVISRKEVEEGLGFAAEHIIRNLPEFTESFQDCASQGLFYKPVKNTDWTNGFWTGEIWLAWEYCRDERLKEAALKQVDSFYDRIINKINVDHHDMGFLYPLPAWQRINSRGVKRQKKRRYWRQISLYPVIMRSGSSFRRGDR